MEDALEVELLVLLDGGEIELCEPKARELVARGRILQSERKSEKKLVLRGSLNWDPTVLQRDRVVPLDCVLDDVLRRGSLLSSPLLHADVNFCGLRWDIEELERVDDYCCLKLLLKHRKRFHVFAFLCHFWSN